MSSSKPKSSSSSDKTKQTTMGNFLTPEKGTRSSSRRHNWDNFTSNVSKYTSSFFANASKRDTEQYRQGYPGKKDDPKQRDNLLFYKNEMASYPEGDYIDKIHKKWWGDYGRLERHHGYIQWLFPIRESGMNWHAQELQLHEAKAIMADPVAKRRVLKSYKMMLDFYGMELLDDETGQIVRGHDYRSRFAHLNRSYHNYLRITRMLKSLGELGYEHLKKPFVEFVLEEALEKETLKNCLESCCKYWLETIKDDKARKYLQNYVQKMEAGYGTENPPYDDYDSDEWTDKADDRDHQNDDNDDDDDENMSDYGSQELKYLQEEEDRLIAMNEQFKEDMLSKGNDDATEEAMDVDIKANPADQTNNSNKQVEKDSGIKDEEGGNKMEMVNDQTENSDKTENTDKSKEIETSKNAQKEEDSNLAFD